LGPALDAADTAVNKARISALTKLTFWWERQTGRSVKKTLGSLAT
jgi:hypothetical protein